MLNINELNKYVFTAWRLKVMVANFEKLKDKVNLSKREKERLDYLKIIVDEMDKEHWFLY